MGTLRAIQITKIHATATDDWSVDEVYYFSTIQCGTSPGNSNIPPTPIPSITSGDITKSTARDPMSVREGVDAYPHTPWGYLFPNVTKHEDCCVEGRGEVSGSIYFFDSELPKNGWLWFGVIVAALISVGITVVVTAASAPAGPAAPVLGGLAGVGSGLGLALLWGKLVDTIIHDQYLGGIRVSFPCSGTGQVYVTHQLVGASTMGITAPGGMMAPSIQGSVKARYTVTIRAAYT